MKFILGSGSPRRLELLGQIGVVPDEIIAPDIDETPHAAELPKPYCARMAAEKSRAIAAGQDDIILCADTTVALGRRIFGKPEDSTEAEAFLRKMAGRRHRVVTAIAVRRGDRFWHREVVSQVKMKNLSDAEIAAYLASGDWKGKAGGYGIQGPAGAFIPWISGSFTGIVGLPLAETANLLIAAGLPIYGQRV